MDHYSAYSLDCVRAGDEWKAAISTSCGRYEYCVMLYELSCAHSIFQRLINDVLQDLLGKFVYFCFQFTVHSWPGSKNTKTNLACHPSILFQPCHDNILPHTCFLMWNIDEQITCFLPHPFMGSHITWYKTSQYIMHLCPPSWEILVAPHAQSYQWICALMLHLC